MELQSSIRTYQRDTLIPLMYYLYHNYYYALFTVLLKAMGMQCYKKIYMQLFTRLQLRCYSIMITKVCLDTASNHRVTKSYIV